MIAQQVTKEYSEAQEQEPSAADNQSILGKRVRTEQLALESNPLNAMMLFNLN